MNASPLKVLADGTEIPSDDPRTDHVAVLFPNTGWMVAVAALTDADGDALDSADLADEAARKLDLLGFTDWANAPLDEVWLRHIVKHDRHRPAADTNLFPNLPLGWFWTGTNCSWSIDPKTGVAASAWGVNAYYGGVGYGRRGGSGFALAARRAGQ